jgi:aminoglycoside phosphotransferase (APT) family kinase protein
MLARGIVRRGGGQVVMPHNDTADGIDLARLQAWLTEHVPGYAGTPHLQRFPGGQSNPTFRLTSSSGDYVLRRRPAGELLASAHAVDREFRVMRAVAGTGVPVARTHALCEDAGVIGSSFYVMDFVDGRVLWDQTLPGLAPDARAALFDAMNATIAALHMVDFRAVGLAGFGRPENYLARQIARWSKQYRASQTTPIDAMDRLIAWLPANMPPRDATGIVHGDFRMDNLIFHPTEPRVIAVLDWELSTIGDPVADFAYHVMSWRISPALFRGLAGVDLAALGIPNEADYVAAYLRRTGGVPVAQWDYYIVFSMFRMAAILQGIARRALDGTAASTQAVDVGGRAGGIAEQAWALARALG